MLRLRWTKSHPIPDEITRNRLNQMRESGILTDMVMCCGLQVYKCHRIVISGASVFLSEVIKAVSCENSAVVVTVNEEHLSHFDLLMQFLYLGELLIEPEGFHGLCRLADQLAIKFLVDGAKKINSPPILQMALPSSSENNKDVHDAQHKIANGLIAVQRSKPLKIQALKDGIRVKDQKLKNTKKTKKGKRVMNNKNVLKDINDAELKLHNLPTISYSPVLIGSKDAPHKPNMTSKDITMAMAKRLKKKALNLLTSDISSIKCISRRKKRVVKSKETTTEKIQNHGDSKNELPVIVPVLHENVRPRRKAYHAAEKNLKMFIAQLRR